MVVKEWSILWAQYHSRSFVVAVSDNKGDLRVFPLLNRQLWIPKNNLPVDGRLPRQVHASVSVKADLTGGPCKLLKRNGSQAGDWV